MVPDLITVSLMKLNGIKFPTKIHISGITCFTCSTYNKSQSEYPMPARVRSGHNIKII